MGVRLWAGMACAFEEASAVNGPAQARACPHDRDNQPPGPMERQKDNTMTTTNKHILVVDDAPASRMIVGLILRPFGYTVHEASDGTQVMTQLCAHPIDLIFLDLDMPEMPGVQALRLIRSMHDDRRTLPVVAYTTVQGPEHVQSLMGMGFDHVCAKPVRSVDLLQQVEAWMRKQAQAAL